MSYNDDEQADKDVHEGAMARADATASDPTTKIVGEINNPIGQAEVLAKLIMAIMKKQGVLTMDISEENFTSCLGWMFSLQQRIRHGKTVLTIVMERVPERKVGN